MFVYTKFCVFLQPKINKKKTTIKQNYDDNLKNKKLLFRR